MYFHTCTLARSWRSGVASVRGDAVADAWEELDDFEGQSENLGDDTPKYPQHSDDEFEEPEPPSVLEDAEPNNDDGNCSMQSYRIGGRWLTHAKVDWSDWINITDDEGVTEPHAPEHECPEAVDQDWDGEPCF